MTARAGALRRELKRRMAAAWFYKMLAMTFGISGFFVAYFWVLHNPQGPVLIMPLMALDRAVPLQPATLPFYFSLWLYVCIAPALLRDARELARYGAAAFVLAAIGLVIFLLWPTSTPAFAVDWDRYPWMAFLKDVDASGNACPSLHVGFAVFSGLWLDRLMREVRLRTPIRFLNLLWCAGIVYSTLAVRQHVVLDVVGGAVLGAAIVLLPQALLAIRATPAVIALVRDVRIRSAGPPGAAPAVSGAGPSRTDRAAGRLRSG